MRYVMGVDPSLTSTGVVILNEHADLVCSERISSKPSGPNVSARMRRNQQIFNEVLECARSYEPSTICIEGYALGANMPGVTYRVEFGGLLRFQIIAAGFSLIEVPPTTLKKWATGKGGWKGGGKVPLIAEVTRRYGVTFDSDDEYDAYALARMALQLAELEQPTNATQREALQVALNGGQTKQVKRKVAK